MLLTHSWGRCDRATDAGQPFYLWDGNILHAKGLKHKSSPLRAPLCEQRWPLSTIPPFLWAAWWAHIRQSCRHKLRGDGLRSAGSLLPSQGSHEAQAAAGPHWQIVNILISTGVELWFQSCWLKWSFSQAVRNTMESPRTAGWPQADPSAAVPVCTNGQRGQNQHPQRSRVKRTTSPRISHLIPVTLGMNCVPVHGSGARKANTAHHLFWPLTAEGKQ